MKPTARNLKILSTGCKNPLTKYIKYDIIKPPRGKEIKIMKEKQFSVVYYVGKNPIPQSAIVSHSILREMVDDDNIVVACVREMMAL